MTQVSNLRDLKPGDRVKVTTITTGVVRKVELNEEKIVWEPYTQNSAHKIEVSTPPKAKEGTRITGAQVKATFWKRGTIIEREGFLDKTQYVLNGAALWMDLDAKKAPMGFGQINDRDLYKLIRVVE